MQWEAKDQGEGEWVGDFPLLAVVPLSRWWSLSSCGFNLDCTVCTQLYAADQSAGGFGVHSGPGFLQRKGSPRRGDKERKRRERKKERDVNERFVKVFWSREF